MAELRKCPFCGYRYASVDRDSDGFAYVQCHKSGCMARTDGCLNEQEAIRLWNTRKPMEVVVAELENAESRELFDYKDRGATYMIPVADAISIVRGKE